MLSDADFNYLGWLEARDWSELEPNDRVIFQGRVWVVVQAVDVDRYTLRSVRNRWQRVNVDRMDVTVGFVDKEERT